MNEDIQDDVQLIMQRIYSDPKGTHDNEPEEEIIHVHHYPDAQLIELPDGTVIFKKRESTTSTNIPIVDSEPHDSPSTQPSMTIAYLTVSTFLFLVLSSILFQLYLLINPLTANVTLIAQSQQISVTGTLQLGRMLNPITLSQSQTVPTTGHGHQDARAATGYITFYNGQLQSVFIPAGTTLTGSSGVQVITDQDANIPAANPPTWGIATASAHTVNTGSSSNIAAYDINQGCCATAVKAVNTTSFSGGQDERNFQTVTTNDIDLTASQLKETLNQATQGALQGEVKAGEQLQSLPCNPTVTPDHQIGQEATTVRVTVSETCSGIAYNDQELTSKVTQLLTTQETKQLGEGYTILGNPQVAITQAAAQHTTVILSFKAQSTWLYALSTQEQNHIKKIIAGKNTQRALRLLHSLPGIESVSLKISGFGDDTRIPKDISHIHMLVIYTAA